MFVSTDHDQFLFPDSRNYRHMYHTHSGTTIPLFLIWHRIRLLLQHGRKWKFPLLQLRTAAATSRGKERGDGDHIPHNQMESSLQTLDRAGEHVARERVNCWSGGGHGWKRVKCYIIGYICIILSKSQVCHLYCFYSATFIQMLCLGFTGPPKADSLINMDPHSEL